MHGRFINAVMIVSTEPACIPGAFDLSNLSLNTPNKEKSAQVQLADDLCS